MNPAARVDVAIVNAFIDGQAGGNPAGVVLGADALGPEHKLSVARRVGLSETAFVSRSGVATVKLEFFTPERQIAHCGHATVATFSLLRQRGMVPEGRLSKETIDGTRAILVEGEMAFMEQRAPSCNAIPADSALGRRISASLGLDPARWAAGTEFFVVNTGNSFLLVPMDGQAEVAALAPRQGEVKAVSDELDLVGYYVFSRQTRVAGRHAGARMFAPRYGIDEEAGTGMAAGPLACLLHDRFGVAGPTLWIEQGWLMEPASPSVIKVALDLDGQGRIRGLMAGGVARATGAVQVDT